jgi:hypothetical protein
MYQRTYETIEEALIHAFRAGHVPEGSFHHADHIRMAWAYLRRWPFAQAAARFSRDLKRFATKHGKPNLYHATVTMAFLALIAERMDADPEAEWDAFTGANPDLLRWKDGPLFDYYDHSILDNPTARRIFILPRPRRP